MKKVFVVLMLVFGLALFATSALAEEGYNAQLFWPSIFGGNFIAIEDAHTLCPLGFGGGLLFNYADGPAELRFGDDSEESILEQLLTADVVFGFGPVSWMSIGVDVPIHLYSKGRSFDELDKATVLDDVETETSLGDIRAEIKFRALRQDKHWIGMAIAPYATFPTGDESLFLGEGRITFGGTLALEHDFKVLNVALNGGYQYRGDSDIIMADVGDAIKVGAGLSREFDFGLSFSVEYWASILSSSDQDDFSSYPMEAMATLRYTFGKNLPRVLAGGGAGLTNGAGAPAFRGVAGVDYYYCKPKPTTGKMTIKVVDQDGNPLAAELKITGPMSLSRTADEDGVWKSKKMHPGKYKIVASMKNHSADTVSASVVISQTTPVTLTLKVWPTLLNVKVSDKFTGQNITSSIVFNPGTKDEKKIAIPDGVLTQDIEAGAYRLLVTADGYEERFINVKLREYKKNNIKVPLRKKIEKIDKIYFDYDSDVIRKESYPVLDDVATKIGEIANLKLIVIEGHSSGEGEEDHNMELSERRAKSVMKYLIGKGVEEAMLQINAYGETRPIAENETEEGRSKNRRVEFIIEEN